MSVWGEKVGVAGGHIGIYILSFLLLILPAWDVGNTSTASYLEAKQLSCDTKGDKNGLRMAGGKTRSPSLPWHHGAIVPNLDF